MSKKTVITILSMLLVLFLMQVPLVHARIDISYYEPCEDIGSFTKTANMVATLDSTYVMEGSKSLKLMTNATLTPTRYIYSNVNSSITHDPAIFYGFYLRVASPFTSGSASLFIWQNQITYYSLYVSVDQQPSNTSQFLMQWVCNGNGHSFGSAQVTRNTNQWYWCELFYHIALDSCGFAVDGVGQGGFGVAGLSSLNSTNVRFLVTSSYAYYGTQYVDYVRIANQTEYPPSNYVAYHDISILALNVATNSSISVPMKINDVEYYTPISASLPSGIYTIQPEGLGFNSTHYWRFVNWTDGADQTRTINFTGSASYTAYYQLAKIQSWGGYFNFFLGLAGLGMMASSWFVLKWQWDEKNYGVAILTWMMLLFVGFALCTILFGG